MEAMKLSIHSLLDLVQNVVELYLNPEISNPANQSVHRPPSTVRRSLSQIHPFPFLKQHKSIRRDSFAHSITHAEVHRL